MISKKTAQRVKEIDFIGILNSEEGRKIRYGVRMGMCLHMDRSSIFLVVASSYLTHLLKIEASEVLQELSKDANILAWINTCILAERETRNSLEIMLAGIYQFIQWEKENALPT
ncbi:MAG: hypothetical protein ACFFG0_08160 [Candidatus Thorarchaeota archaeon]